MKGFVVLIASLALFHIQDGTAAPPLSEVKFPAQVHSIDGSTIDVARLVREKRVVVITLKATWCRVCQEQLYRLKGQSALKHCEVTFLVLSPGPREALKAIQKRTGFSYPFVEDRDLAIAGSLGLRSGEAEILPSIFILNEDRSLAWIQRGRGPNSFSDSELLEQLGCAEVI